MPPPERTIIVKLMSIDFLGALLMLAATALLIVGLEEAALQLNWTVATVLGPLCASVVVWVAFFANSWWVTGRQGSSSIVEPVFPWRFCRSRVVVGLLL